MKRFYLMLSLIILGGIVTCQSQDNKESNKDFPIEVTDEYIKVKSWVRFDKPEFGTLYDYTLKKPKIIQSIPCKGRFTVDSKGKLYGFTLSKDFEFNGNLFPKGSRYEGRVDFNNQRNGYMIYLSKEFEVQGYFVRSKGAFMEDYKLDFYQNNKLRGFKLVNDTEIDGISCKGGKKDYVLLYPDGKLGQCTLSKDINIHETFYTEGTTIVVDKDGEIFDKDEAIIKVDFYIDINN